MTLTLHNTLTRRKEPLRPVDASHVRMYVCGPTVYDYAHVGNARPVVVFDVLCRLLKRLYPRVTYVRNITDVDDKIIAASKATGESIRSVTTRTEAAYHEDVAALGALPPDVEPRATEHVAEMVRMIETLIAAGHAYAADGHVLFSVPSMRAYGRLSRHGREELIAGARVEVAPYKKDAADFVLWKPSAPELPGWNSPWGRGRPGWHIECSAMSEKYLGVPFDIHGGGQDLIFPHHENELAQSTCAHGGGEFARHWVHNGHLMVEGEKMSKSLGNFYTVRDLLQEHPGEAIRLVLLHAHYRQPLDFTKAALAEARQELDRFYGAFRKAAAVEAVGRESPTKDVLDALCDDLNTPLALHHARNLLHILNREIEAWERNPTRESAEQVAGTKGSLLAAGALLGLWQQPPDAWFNWQRRDAEGIGEAEIEAAIAARAEARKARNFAEADRIRKELLAKGVALEDTAKGTLWRRG